MKYLMILTSFVFLSTATYSQKVDEVKIQTSAVCGMCKKTIEDGLYTQKGIISASLVVESGIVTIKYRTKKTDVATIRKYISSIGYDADDVPAEEGAYSNLPGCCKKDVGKH